MPLNAFEEFDLNSSNREKLTSRKAMRQETRRQRHEAMRRLDRYVKELSRYQQPAPADYYESPTRLD